MRSGTQHVEFSPTQKISVFTHGRENARRLGCILVLLTDRKIRLGYIYFPLSVTHGWNNYLLLMDGIIGGGFTRNLKVISVL